MDRFLLCLLLRRSASVVSVLTATAVIGVGILAGSVTPAAAQPVNHIVPDPGDLPPPIGVRPPRHVRVELEAVELQGRLDDGSTYTYWTFNGKVPGPFIRVRVGDTVEVHLNSNVP